MKMTQISVIKNKMKSAVYFIQNLISFKFENGCNGFLVLIEKEQIVDSGLLIMIPTINNYKNENVN